MDSPSPKLAHAFAFLSSDAKKNSSNLSLILKRSLNVVDLRDPSVYKKEVDSSILLPEDTKPKYLQGLCESLEQKITLLNNMKDGQRKFGPDNPIYQKELGRWFFNTDKKEVARVFGDKTADIIHRTWELEANVRQRNHILAKKYREIEHKEAELREELKKVDNKVNILQGFAEPKKEQKNLNRNFSTSFFGLSTSSIFQLNDNVEKKENQSSILGRISNFFSNATQPEQPRQISKSPKIPELKRLSLRDPSSDLGSKINGKEETTIHIDTKSDDDSLSLE